MLVEINHSVPNTPPSFVIIQPYRGEFERRMMKDSKLYDPDKYSLKDKKSGKITLCKLVSLYNYYLEENSDGLCFLAYNKPIAQLRDYLKESYPELRKPNARIEYLILQKL